MRALDHVNRVDLDVSEMRDRSLRGSSTPAERLGLIEPLRAQPEPSCVILGELVRVRAQARNFSRNAWQILSPARP